MPTFTLTLYTCVPTLTLTLLTRVPTLIMQAFHERRERDSRLCVGGKPWCLTRVTDNTVAVSLPVSTQICVIKVTPRLALLSSFFAQVVSCLRTPLPPCINTIVACDAVFV